MSYEETGFMRLAASTGAMRSADATGAMEIETSASMLGAVVAMSAIAGVVVGAVWVRSRSVNSSHDESRALAEGGDDPRKRGRKVIYDPAGRPGAEEGRESPPRRRVMEAPELPARGDPVYRGVRDFTKVGEGLASGRGLVMSWVVEKKDDKGRVVEINVIGIDPNPEFERRELPVTRTPTGGDPRAEATYEAAVPLTGRYKIKSFTVPVIGNRLGAPTATISATDADRQTYRENVPPSVFGGQYPWATPEYSPKTFRHAMAEFRAYMRQIKGKK